MSDQKNKSGLLPKILKPFLAVKEFKGNTLPDLKNILIVRQHNQFGDLLANVSLFRALKEKYPKSKITIIVSPANYYAITKNNYIDDYFLFDKKKLYRINYLISLISLLRKKYDLAITPVTVAISFTSNLLCRLSKSKIRFGIKKLNGELNPYYYFFNKSYELGWDENSEMSTSEFGQSMVKDFGIYTEKLSSAIHFDDDDKSVAENFLIKKSYKKYDYIIGVHTGAGKPPNRWDMNNFKIVLEELSITKKCLFIFTGSKADKQQLEFVEEKINVDKCFFVDKEIPQLAALISICNLFITNDTGVMHVAGTTDTPQVSLFGPTNPHQWAPVGKNKIYFKKGDDINETSPDEVIKESLRLLDYDEN